QILNLRNDPTANALMAGALTQSNGELLTARIGRTPSEGELYLAHFLGVAGASTLIKQARFTPQANAATLFPRAAQANHAIFYDRDGASRSVAQVYRTMVGRYDVARAQSPDGPTTIAPARVAQAQVALPLVSAKPAEQGVKPSATPVASADEVG